MFILAGAEVRDVVMCHVKKTQYSIQLRIGGHCLFNLAGIIISIKQTNKQKSARAVLRMTHV